MATRTKQETDRVVITLPMARGVLARIDRAVEGVRKDHPHQPVSRVSVIRHILSDALDGIECERDAGVTP